VAATGTATVVVHVTDVNDNRPRFSRPLYEVFVSQWRVEWMDERVRGGGGGWSSSRPLYEVFVSENTPAGSVVVTVDAVDEDDADNGLVEYQSTTPANN